MRYLQNILLSLSILCFCFSGGLIYAFVFDCEPLSAEKMYEMDRDVFNHYNDNWDHEYMSFGEWEQDQRDREGRMHEWLGEVSKEVGMQFAEIFDPECRSGGGTPSSVTGERESNSLEAAR